MTTRNYLLDLGDDGTVVRSQALQIVPDGPPVHPAARVRGVEDLRLVRIGDRWLASGTVRDRNPEQRCEVALMSIDESGINGLTVLTGPEPDRPQKNWMPFVHDDTLHFVYWCSPTVVLRYDEGTGALTKVADHEGPAVAEGFRGGSPGVPVDDGYVFAVHEVRVVDGERTYAHRLVRMSRDLVIDAVSPRFCFERSGVEYCAGLAVHGDELLLAVGIGDCEARVYHLPAAAALDLLRPVC